MDAVRSWNDGAGFNIRRFWTARPLLKAQMAVTTLLCIAAAVLLIMARGETGEAARGAANGLSGALARHIGDLVNLYDFDLKTVADAIDRGGGDIVPNATRQTIVSSVGPRAKALRLLAVLNSKGDLVFESVSTSVRQANFADRDYFQAQMKPSVGLYVSRPFIGRLDGELEFALSRRLTHKDGSFAGVVFGVIKLSLLKELFDATATGREGSITLFRKDGVVMMRKPYRDGYIGRDVSGSGVFPSMIAQPTGFYDGPAAIDGIDRLYAFRHIGSLPMMISVGASKSEVYAAADHGTLLVAAIILALGANTLVLAVVRARRRQR